jgi:hypothetical protein
MAIDTTTLMREVNQIANNGANPVWFSWSATIMANNVKVPILKIVQIDVKRNYDKNYSDKVTVTCSIPAGVYQHQLYPYKDNLLMTLTKTPIGETSGTPSTTADIEGHQMRATLSDNSSKVIEGNSPYSQSQVAADLSALQTVSFQLIDLALEQIRMKSVGGVMTGATPGDSLRYFMTSLSQGLKVPAQNQIRGVDMVTPDNTVVRDHVLVPHGMPFADVPGHIHQNCGGIYNGGFGFYLQQGLWYIYPQHNTNRWATTPKNLTLINLPKNKMPNTERTYRKTNNQLIVLLTGNTQHQDDSDAKQLNQGNGTRFTDATKIMRGFGKALNNKFSVDRSANNNEFITQPRSTGLNNVQQSDRKITSNNFYELGKMARRQGGHILTEWQNSDPGSLYPGMPTKYIYTVNDQVIEVYGTLMACEHTYQQIGSGPNASRFTSNSALTIFIDNTINWNSADSGSDENA